MKIIPDRLKTPIAKTIESFSLTSKIIFAFLTVLMVGSGLVLVKKFNDTFLVTVPARGGTIIAGLVGTPRLINPVIVQNDAGKDIVSLVYSGLMKRVGGGLEPDLAKSYTVSTDGLTYTFELKPNLTFHDGSAVTARDIVFTIKTIENPDFRSPKRARFDGVKVEATSSDSTVIFTLPSPSNDFLSYLTVGILPEHIWKSVSADDFMVIEYNSSPIGTGPYMVKSQDRTKNGLPTEYNLTAFKNYASKKPFITNVIFKIFQNENDAEKAFLAGKIDSIGGILPDQAVDLKNKGYRVEEHTLPRMFGVFFNQSHNPVLADAIVRKVLSATTPRQTIVDSVFKGFATPIDSPFVNSLAMIDQAASGTAIMSISDAAALLDKNGWKLGEAGIRSKKIGTQVKELAFSIDTSDADDLKETAEILRDTWKPLGINVSVNIYESGELNQTVIRSRKYDALLFGEVVSNNSDYVAFWHSSQRNDPGLNVAMYASSKADSLLNDLKNSTSSKASENLKALDTEFRKDIPAIMLYSPVYLNAIPKSLLGYYQGPITDASCRLSTITSWYDRIEKVWPIFASH